MTDALTIDKRQVRRAFEQAAASYDASAALQHEICSRMQQRLDYVKHAPSTVLDAGSGTGNAVPALHARYPRATLVELDLAHAMVKRARRRLRWWQGLPALRSPIASVCADLERLPLADGCVDLVWSNLALQWAADLPRALTELNRVLASGGLLMFSTFGPDTLKELRRAYAGADAYPHVSRFIDMHDIGDMLLAARYADPVMDMEQVTLTYDDVRSLMRDLKAIGAGNAALGRRHALSPKSLLAAVQTNYEGFRRDGKLPATFEIVYGHAWKPKARTGPGGRPVIEVKPVTSES